MPTNYEANKQAIDVVVARFFAAFANEGGQAADLDDLNRICLSGCVIVKTCGDTPVLYDLPGFIAPRKKLLNEGELIDFCEHEVWERTDIFGSLAQRFCLYEKSGLLLGDRFEAKGMKSIQLVNTVAGWKISSVAWDDERDGVAVPSKYEITSI